MISLYHLIDTILYYYTWILGIWVVLNWLIAFNVINTRNRAVYTIGDFLDRVTEPALRPIRRVIPNVSGIDMSPIALGLLIFFVRMLLSEYWPR